MPARPENNDPRPVAPRRPGNDECCRSGCSPCIFDLYTEDLALYETALRAWEERQASLKTAKTPRARKGR
ncbi:MAG TPA: oxidoreductase-like domain-containing protein [Noviherbaspirillum sp.]|uniref:oxidoreductase-like domain-containing protein n=1 Tax=Noviherbaspirillum sp. TaxID=1926288 RepID=UPI002DDD500A|nr:oxidoreductase-like domain-containing protein [Noviherbaspirillum sp.]HEV2611044.1 oxidoreductase-like domain-containing protein [Noviherbaspirillum sp.]